MQGAVAAEDLHSIAVAVGDGEVGGIHLTHPKLAKLNKPIANDQVGLLGLAAPGSPGRRLPELTFRGGGAL